MKEKSCSGGNRMLMVRMYLKKEVEWWVSRVFMQKNGIVRRVSQLESGRRDKLVGWCTCYMHYFPANKSLESKRSEREKKAAQESGFSGIGTSSANPLPT